MESTGARRVGYWVKTVEDAKKQMQAMRRIPAENYKAMVIAPLASEKFDPDVILIYGNPAQMILLINGLQWTDYERLHFFCIGESACSDAIAECYWSKKPALAIPCYGERRFGHVQDDELVIALPAAMLSKAADGLKALSRVGLRYPIPPYGAESNPIPAMERIYGPWSKQRQGKPGIP